MADGEQKTRSNTLTKAEDFKLMSLMTEELESSGKSAAEFAEYAREKLAIPQINKDHVYFRAKELGLKIQWGPKGRVEIDPAMFLALNQKVTYLEEQLETLRIWFKENFSHKGPRL
jgi:hypothetical protein